jgi:dCMP deaminase
MSRPSWDEYFLEVVDIVAKRSTCLRRQVGAVIVKENRILATGYNGAPRGLLHCEEVGCIRDEKNVPSGERHELCRGIHAEMNAIFQSAAYGIPIAGSKIYVTCQPCCLCAKMIINCRIETVIIKKGYPDKLACEMLEKAGVQLIRSSQE